MRRFEASIKSTWDPARAPASGAEFGDNPYRIAQLSQQRLIGILRGSSRVVLLDQRLRVVAHAEAPKNPTALFVDVERRLVYVAGEHEARIAVYQVDSEGLSLSANILLPMPFGIRDLVVPEPGRAYAVAEHVHHVLELGYPTRAAMQLHTSASQLESGRIARVTQHELVHGPCQLHLLGDKLIVNAVFDHRLIVYRQASSGLEELARVDHDGPFWGLALAGHQDQFWMIAGGVENRPLDRSSGNFGYIDSYLYIYAWDGSRLSQRASINVSDRDVVTPKALFARASSDGDLAVLVTGYGSSRALSLVWRDDTGVRRERAFSLPPGTSSATSLGADHFALANPLLDAWVELTDETYRVVPSGQPPGDSNTRLGEALFFTTLMASANTSEGELSRFSCETCHFEGYGDGRVHHSGREKIHAVTKPLLGMFNNPPLFSRALDRDLSQMTHNEFKVANAGSGRDPWFQLDQSEQPWLEWLQLDQPSYSPLELRQALISFFQRFTHEAAPSSQSRANWTASERRGASLFRQHCEGCHAARLETQDPQSRQPFERWESLTLQDNPPLVWASQHYHKTGIEPYMHARGTRVPSLRRLYKKWPYFTDGSAKSLGDVLDRIRVTESGVQHASPVGAALSTGDKQDLSPFLQLL